MWKKNFKHRSIIFGKQKYRSLSSISNLGQPRIGFSISMSYAIFRTNIYIIFIWRLIFILSNHLLIICNSNLTRVLCFIWQLNVEVCWAHLFEAGAHCTLTSFENWTESPAPHLPPSPVGELCGIPVTYSVWQGSGSCVDSRSLGRLRPWLLTQLEFGPRKWHIGGALS